MKIYFGYRTSQGPQVKVCDQAKGHTIKPLPMRNDLFNHSPDGPNWGYQGSGPAQLALALLADALQDDEAALDLHQHYKIRVVAMLGEESWLLFEEDVLLAVVQILGEQIAEHTTYTVTDDGQQSGPDGEGGAL